MKTKHLLDGKNFNVKSYAVVTISVILLNRVEAITRVGIVIRVAFGTRFAFVTRVADVKQLNIGATRCLKINMRTEKHISRQTHRPNQKYQANMFFVIYVPFQVYWTQHSTDARLNFQNVFCSKHTQNAYVLILDMSPLCKEIYNICSTDFVKENCSLTVLTIL